MSTLSEPTNSVDQPDQPWPVDPDDPNAAPPEQPGTWPEDPDSPAAPQPTPPAEAELGESREPA